MQTGAHPNTNRDIEAIPDLSGLEFHTLQIGENGSPFRTLNEEWINRYFTLEKKDRETLNDPENAILRKGGAVFIARVGGEAIGCAALILMGDRVYELSKMAVSPTMRGLGIGRRLLLHSIDQARALGARAVFLASNSILKDAIHLYETVGFRHVPADTLPPLGYTRSDVYMEMPL